MKKTIAQAILLLLLVSVLLGGFLTVRHVLKLSFRSTNDALHKKDSAFTLDFLIPSGTYIDEKMTIGEVIRLRYKKESSFYEKILRALADQIPQEYRYLANLFLFLSWCFLFMTFFRVFTFMGYARTLRVSLLFGSLTYYFIPDFSPGKGDDILFVSCALLVILIRFILKRRRKRSLLDVKT
ncbi:MAG: hypothetical protein JRH06_05400 [Deltaproteobacteria bacterium]|nr:hypothetical protein [Deltaproteobacteria bacterium]MBW2136973.1 hypothetical protein [Deltaproteobacteria bacterium]